MKATSALPGTISFSRSHNDPIGPPSKPIDPLAFALESSLVLSRMQDSIKKYKEVLGEGIGQRCRVTEWEEETKRIEQDEIVMGELRRWHEARIAPSSGVAAVAGEGEEEVEEPSTTAAAPAFVLTNPRTLEIVKKGEQGGLGILRRLKDVEFYVRKTRQADYNTLTSVRSSLPPTAPTPPSLAPLSSILYTLQFQSIARYSSRVPFTVRAQTLILRGSNTLEDLRVNLMVGGDGIPREEEASDDDEEEEEDGERKRKRVKWTKEKRKAGSVFAIEGVLHPDKQEGVLDYAQLVMSGIEATNWNAAPTTQDDATAESNIAVDPSLTLGAEEDGQYKPPSYKIGSAMTETRIGELNLRENAVYWYLHQGNCEHIWTVSSIRHTHPSDPTDQTTYPLTTFLSRLSEPKCRLCDRDPGVVVTLNDELAGESPSLLCRTCFECLHGDGEGVEVVPTLVDDGVA